MLSQGGWNNPIINAPNFEIYDNSVNDKNPKQRYRWRIKVSGNIVASSSEGYEDRAKALTNVKNLESHIKWLRENGKLV